MDTMDRIPCCSVSMHIKHLKLVKPQPIYAESNRNLHTVIRPRNHDNGQGDRYHGDGILSVICTFLSIVLRMQLMCKSFLPWNVFKQKPLSLYNVVFFLGGGRIFDVIISYPTSQLEKLLYSSIYFITMGSINDVSYRIMTLFWTWIID